MMIILLVCVVGVYSNQNEITKHFSTVTPYEMKHHYDESLEGFEIVYSELVQRHGSRNPTKGKILGMSKIEDLLKKYTTYEWVNPFTVEMEGELIQRGVDELIALGKFYKKLLNPLFKNHELSQVNVSCTYKKRTCDSGIAFLKGFYEDDEEKYNKMFINGVFDNTNEYVKVKVTPKEIDAELGFFRICPRYDEYMEMNSTFFDSKTYLETIKPIIAGKVFDKLKRRNLIKESVLRNNQQLLEFKRELTKTIDSFFRSASYEYITFDKTDGLLTFFDVEDAKAFEYVKDLETYRTKSVSNEITHHIAIPLLESLMKNIQSHLPMNEKNGYIHVNKEKAHILGTFRFAHAETVTPLMTLLGINLDRFELSLKTKERLKSKRKWNMSKISPFSTQLMFVVVKDNRNQYYIKTYFNQEAVILPAFPYSTLCPIEEFMRYYGKYTENFDFNAYCSK